MFINLFSEIQIMIDEKHRWHELIDNNLYEETRVLNSVTNIHKKYLEEKSAILDVSKKDKIIKQIQSLEDDVEFVSAVLGEIIQKRLNLGSTMTITENLQAFGFYITDCTYCN